MYSQKIIDAVVLTAGAQTDNNITILDFDKIGTTAEFILSAKTLGNSVQPGTPRTVTVNYYWADEDPTGAVAADLASGGKHFLRKTATTAIALINAASKTTYAQCNTTPIRPQARFMIVSIDKTTEDANALTTLTVWLRKLRSTTARF